MKTKLRLLPHEIIFGAFLMATWLRLVFCIGFFAPNALFYLTLLSISGVLIHWCVRKETNLRWRARLLFYFVAMNLAYAHLKVAVPAMRQRAADGLLQKVDRWLVGTNLSLRMETLVHPMLTEFVEKLLSRQPSLPVRPIRTRHGVSPPRLRGRYAQCREM